VDGGASADRQYNSGRNDMGKEKNVTNEEKLMDEAFKKAQQEERKAAKQAAQEAKKAEAAAKKAAKQAEKEAKQAEREVAKAAKEAEKEAKQAEKALQKAAEEQAKAATKEAEAVKEEVVKQVEQPLSGLEKLSGVSEPVRAAIVEDVPSVAEEPVIEEAAAVAEETVTKQAESETEVQEAIALAEEIAQEMAEEKEKPAKAKKEKVKKEKTPKEKAEKKEKGPKKEKAAKKEKAPKDPNAKKANPFKAIMDKIKAKKAAKAEDEEEVVEKTKFSLKKLSKDSLITKMIGAFMVLIVIIIAVGMVSYMVAKKTLSDQMNSSLSQTVSAKGTYMELAFQQIDDQMVKLLTMEPMLKYYLDPKLDTDNLTDDQLAARGEIESEMQNLKAISEFVYHIYLLSDMANGLTTTCGKLTNEYFTEFIESEVGNEMYSAFEKYGYVGEHPYLEELVHRQEERFDCSDYAISMWRKVNIKTTTMVVVDIKREAIYNALSELDNGDGSYVVFIAPDGNETVYCGTDGDKPVVPDNLPVFSELSAYKKAVESDKVEGYSTIQFQGESYVFAYYKVGETGSVLFSLVPTSKFLGATKAILLVTVIMVLAAFAIALVMCLLLARSMSKGISDITRPLERAAKGDFTVKMKVKRKDEFGQIAVSISSMMDGIKSLIAQIKEVMETVTNATGLVGDSTDRLIQSSDEISSAIGEIENGVTVQAEDSQECVVQINTLSEQIGTVYDYTDEISKISEDANRTITEGMDVIGDLNEKSKATVEITEAIQQDIKSLSEQTKSIGGFASVINDIASQTNLLSLNASIEAARAGEAGRGFSVVAEEIRKLAEQSLKAAKQIGGIVDQIQKQTGLTVNQVNKAEEIVASQSSALNDTLDAFNKVNERVKTMGENLTKIAEGMAVIEDTKKEAVNAIMNISAVSEETSANSVEVDANAKRQKEYVEELRKTVELLEEKAEQMDTALSALKVE